MKEVYFKTKALDLLDMKRTDVSIDYHSLILYPQFLTQTTNPLKNMLYATIDISEVLQLCKMWMSHCLQHLPVCLTCLSQHHLYTWLFIVHLVLIQMFNVVYI